MDAMRKLAAMSGPLEGTVFALVEPSLTVGRADESMICLDDDQVSRHHALLIAEGDEYRVRDLNSANGTFVNGQRVTEARLTPGDQLQIGAVAFEYERESGKGRPVSSVAPGRALPQKTVMVSGSSVAALKPFPRSEPVAAVEEKMSRKAWTIFWVGVGVADCIFLGWFTYHLLEQRRVKMPVTPATMGERSPPIYADAKGRFACAVPAGWRVEEMPDSARSKVAFVDGSDEIRVIAQLAEAASLTEADRTAVVQAFHTTIARAGTGRLLDTGWREVGQTKALQVEVEVDAPRYFWMRQVKFRQNGVDHTVALYVGAPERREQMTSLFEKFLQSYRSPQQEGRR